MADNVQWIKFKVGTFDGNSFKRIKRARIDGVVDFRDKLTAVWFELLDLGGKVNNSGYLTSEEIAFISYDDIAIALDRTTKEVEMCINWFIDNKMMEIIDNVYLISNWNKYQNIDALEKIRIQNAERQQRFRDKQKITLIEMKQNDEIDKKDDNVTVTLRNGDSLISKSSSDSDISNSNKKHYGEFDNVLLTDNELDKLKVKTNYWMAYIEKLSSYMKSKGKRYKNHYATILTWLRKDEEEKKPGDTKKEPKWMDDYMKDLAQMEG